MAYEKSETEEKNTILSNKKAKVKLLGSDLIIVHY